MMIFKCEYRSNITLYCIERLNICTIVSLEIQENVFDMRSVELNHEIVELVDVARPELNLVSGEKIRLGVNDFGLLFDRVANLFLPVDQCGLEYVKNGQATRRIRCDRSEQG